jgi:hypothetical protein
MVGLIFFVKGRLRAFGAAFASNDRREPYGHQTPLSYLQHALTTRSKSMDFKNVRHLREILVTDAHGKATGKMQYSSQNASHFRPNFVDVPPNDQARAHALYLKWGGIRRADVRIGIAVVIPDRAKGESERYEFGRAE